MAKNERVIRVYDTVAERFHAQVAYVYFVVVSGVRFVLVVKKGNFVFACFRFAEYVGVAGIPLIRSIARKRGYDIAVDEDVKDIAIEFGTDFVIKGKYVVRFCRKVCVKSRVRAVYVLYAVRRA